MLVRPCSEIRMKTHLWKVTQQIEDNVKINNN
jgi:hypothetical protein